MNGAMLIAAERERQVNVCGFSAPHDDDHDDESLVQCAVLVAGYRVRGVRAEQNYATADWVLNRANHVVLKHADDRMKQLVIAGALIAAEIDRLLRLEGSECHAG